MTNSAGSTISAAATLTVTTTTITAQPASATVSKGTKVTLSVKATGTGLTYQWQYSNDGTTWRNCSMAGNNTPSFSFTASAGLNGRQYRCIVTGSDGIAVTSNAAKLTVK